jgi:hypothetical protein
MSRQFRYRVAALVMGGLLVGGPMLTSGTASAEQVTEGGRQVTFGGGGVLGLSCRSQPNVESMSVPADSTVRVVNRTGHSANLQLSGDTKGMLADGAATEVVFRRGTTSVRLQPSCALGNDATPVLVTAVPSAPAAMPDPIPVPSAPGSSSPAVEPADPSRPSGSSLPDGVSAAARPAHPAGQPAASRSGSLHGPAVARAATTAAQAMPQGDGDIKIKGKGLRGTRGSIAPAFAGMPPGDKPQLLPGVPHLDLVPGAGAAAAGVPTREAAAAEPVAAMEPMREEGPVGLLGLIAAVCVLGVGAAAIRAIVSQHTNTAKMV